MRDVVYLFARVLSAPVGIVLLGASIERIVGKPEASDVFWAVVFLAYAGTLGLNLVRLPRVVAIAIAVLHAIGAVYLAKFIIDWTEYALGESGSKAGLLVFYLPYGFVLATLLISVISNLGRPEEALRRNR